MMEATEDMLKRLKSSWRRFQTDLRRRLRSFRLQRSFRRLNIKKTPEVLKEIPGFLGEVQVVLELAPEVCEGVPDICAEVLMVLE